MSHLSNIQKPHKLITKSLVTYNFYHSINAFKKKPTTELFLDKINNKKFSNKITMKTFQGQITKFNRKNLNH